MLRAVDFPDFWARAHISEARLAVDWWIRERRGLASPPHPSGRTESCTLHILRMLLLVLTEGLVRREVCMRGARSVAFPLFGWAHGGIGEKRVAKRNLIGGSVCSL